jgi:phospholipase C
LSDDPIKHVVLLMLENASCDRYLGCLTESILPDFSGINKSSPGMNIDDDKMYYQEPTDDVQVQFDPHHEQIDAFAQMQGKNGGFVSHFASCYPQATEHDRQQIMSYFPYGKLLAHHVLAANFRPCDQWFSALPGPTWPNRFFALSGSSNGLVVMPGKNFWKTNRMLFSEIQPTIFSCLADAKKTFKIFYHDFPSSLILLSNLRQNVRSNFVPFERFESVAAGKESDFPEFTFIEARYYGVDQNDDHPPHNVMKGQKLVAQVYNSIRKNEELWANTLFVILHDEHGGFYDHVVPPMTAVPPNPMRPTDEYNFTQYGLRVPAILVSPWVKHGTERTLFDHTSILKYLREKWSLGDLGDRVSSASTNSVRLALDFTHPQNLNSLPSISIPPDDKIASPHPEWELSSTSHHYANDLFLSVISDDAGALAVEEISANGLSKKSIKPILAKALIRLSVEFCVDFIKGIYEKSEVTRLRKAAKIDKKKDRIQTFLNRGGISR